MGFFEAWKMAIKSILGKKGRSMLTMLGVIIGVGAVIAAVAYAQGTTKNITDSITSQGTNLVQIMITGRGSNRKVTYDQLKDFATQNSNLISGVAPSVNFSGVTVKNGALNMSTTTVLGTTPDYATMRSRGAVSGRYIMDTDVDQRQRVAVIGSAVANTLFPGQNPVGQKVKLNGYIFTVIGILETVSTGEASTEDDYIVIPFTVAERLSGNATIRNFAVEATDPNDVNEVVTVLENFLYGIFNSTTAYVVQNSQQMLETLNSVTGTMMALLGGIAAISLIVGGIGIMNIMMVSVTERTREIGIRKAIGAKRRSILIQFLIEAVVVTGLGGLIGIALGVAVIKFIFGGFNIVPEAYSVPWMTVSFGISLGVGVLFGMFPAVKASNLNPIEALRFE